MMLVLRKSCGPWSAGTEVEIVSETRVRTVREVPISFEHIQGYQTNSPKSIIKQKAHAEFDVTEEDLVTLRPRTKNPTGQNRKQRRLKDPLVIAKCMAFERKVIDGSY